MCNRNYDMLTKDEVINTLKQLPSNFALDELIDKLILIEKVKEGIRQSENDEIVSHKDAKMKLSKWLK